MTTDSAMPSGEAPVVLCLVRDLLFFSKIRSVASQAGVILKSIRDPAQLLEMAGAGLIADLNQPHALAAAVAWRQRASRPVVGFVSHVDTATIDAARQAGIERVLARSQFEQHLPAILRELGK